MSTSSYWPVGATWRCGGCAHGESEAGSPDTGAGDPETEETGSSAVGGAAPWGAMFGQA
jgi:hypothetical protein